MFLKSLRILDKTTVIRDIIFHQGLNLIVDQTPSDDKTHDSGNNVGKTTVLRLIDFCLGGDPKSIWIDPEFKDKINETVRNYLLNEDILIELILKKSLAQPESNEIKIERNFKTHSKNILRINGNKILSKDFEHALKKMIFNSSLPKPSFRQIIPKNIRYSGNELENVLKYLNAYTSNEEYEALYFFLFGVELDNSELKIQLKEELNAETKFRDKLNISDSEAGLETKLKFISDDLDEKIEIKNSIFANNTVNKLNELDSIRIILAKLTEQLSPLKLRQEMLSDSIKDLTNEKENINVDELENLYQSVSSFNFGEINKSFSDLINYHNKMIENKLKFMKVELEKTSALVESIGTQIYEAEREEQNILNQIENSHLILNIQSLLNEIKELSTHKGKLEQQLSQLKASNKKISDIEKDLKGINEKIREEHLNTFKNNISIFNNYFAYTSSKLYGQRYFLEPFTWIDSKNPSKTANLLTISCVENNAGTGRKKGNIASFEFAYVQYCDANNIKCLHFAAQDQIESIYGKQISTLIELSNEINIQYITPVIKDKLPQDLDIAKYQIVSLAPDDKLFRI